ncbi:hypothetical protein [Longimicrobium sp.]|uniref:hypothetical protein n=1 Tax=Longimicrobium sp. TaxID=2029185 RepID=UPI002E323A8C|nr:hypothetical protein [Longimicrobium sp.]HEX6037569.1 hypothetical protein [Longimicrobium sp.]
MLDLSRRRVRIQSHLRRLGMRFSRPANLSTRARAALGENAAARFAEFRQYRDGWDFGRGRRLSAGSVRALERFVDAGPCFPTRPSLFLTQDGMLELAWEDHAGRRVEVELLPGCYLYFVEGEHDDEGVFEPRQVPALLAHLGLEGESE